MAESIDVHDLPEEEVKFIKKLVELLGEKAKIKKAKTGDEEIIFGVCPLGIKGKLSRREIYD
jgi:hypothetical protein